MSPTGSFFHNVASPRTLVDANVRKQTIIPLTKLGATIVTGTVQSVGDKSVTLSSGQELPFDYLVIASGISYNLPCKLLTAEEAKNSLEASKQGLDSAASALAAATSVVVIGGGPVGCEIAGEIKSAHPGKIVTVVHNGSKLLTSASGGNGPLPAKLQDALMGKMEGLGIKVVLEAKGEVSGAEVEHGMATGQHVVKLSNGTEIPSDFTVNAVSGKPNTGFLRSGLLSSSLDEQGFIKVSNSFQVEGHPNIFALGDVAARKEAKMAFFAGKKHAPAVASNISAICAAKAKGKGEPKLKTVPLETKPVMFITLGPKTGAGVLPNGTVVGSKIVSMLKGKTLFVGQTAKDFGFKAGTY